MLGLLSLIPQGLNILGTGVTGIFSWLNKKQDVDLEKYREDGKVNVKQIDADVSVIQARTALALALKDDATSKWGRRLFIYPTGAWYSLVVWRSIVQEHSWLHEYSWVVKALPNNLDYIPYAVVAFLLVTAFRGPR